VCNLYNKSAFLYIFRNHFDKYHKTRALNYTFLTIITNTYVCFSQKQKKQARFLKISR